jgi:hypothetical protein
MTESLNAESAACKAQAASNGRDLGFYPIRFGRRPGRTSHQATGPNLALARLEAALNLVDDVNPALAADQTVVAVTAAQLMGNIPQAKAARDRRFLCHRGHKCQSKPGQSEPFGRVKMPRREPIFGLFVARISL